MTMSNSLLINGNANNMNNTNGIRNNNNNNNNNGTSNNNNNNTTTTNQRRRNPSSSNSNQQQQQNQQQFYPKLITYQIISLQCFYYTILSICFQINHVLYGTSITIDRIFTDKYVTTFSKGWPDAIAILVTSTLG